MEGVVKWFNFQKGYGFITPSGDEKDVFVHKTSLEKNGIRTLTEGQKVTFCPSVKVLMPFFSREVL